jgi:anti-sigma factor RsiW
MSKHLSDKLIDYAWGMLTPQDKTRADAHLRECADCRAELAQHQSITGKLAATVPALLTASRVPPGVRKGWAAIAEHVPQLRKSTPATRRHGLPGFVAVGLAMSAAVVILVAVMTQAWFITPPMTATAPYPTTLGTPVASATYTPERPTAVATPVVFLYPTPMQAPRPATLVATARP